MLLNALSLQSVQPKAGTPGVAVSPPDSASAPAAAASPPSGSNLLLLLPVLVLVPMLFSSFRRNKKEQEQRAKLKKGDRVVSQSGLIGELVEMDERVAKVKIAPGTNVQMLVTTISALDPASSLAKPDGDKALADLKDAKVAADKK